MIELAFKLTKLACRASWINSSAFSSKIGLRTNLDLLVRFLGELQELLGEAEDPYLELENGDLRAV